MTTEQRIQQLERRQPPKNLTKWLEILRPYAKNTNHSEAELIHIADTSDSVIGAILKLYRDDKIYEVKNEQ